MVEIDLIERKAVYKALDNIGGCGATDDWAKGYDAAIDAAICIVGNTPAADVAPVKHGHWILLRESEITGFNPEFAGRDPIGGYQCSNCKEEAILDCNDEFVLSNYCPNCGARMDKE